MNRYDFAAPVEQLPTATAVLEGPQHVFVGVSTTDRRIVGRTDPTGKPLPRVPPELEPQGILRRLDDVLDTGVSFAADGDDPGGTLEGESEQGKGAVSAARLPPRAPQ